MTTNDPRAQDSAARDHAARGHDGPTPLKTTPWWVRVLVVVGALPGIFAIIILAVITRYSMAHDEDRCPYHPVETRNVAAGVSVREDARRCIDEVEEHRWLIVRGTAQPLEVGRYPLEADQIDRGFPWEATIEDQRVVITVTNEGRGELVFREPVEQGER